MRQISAAELHALKVAELSLDPDAVDLTSVEALSGALRRAASFLCPCTAATLVQAVVRPLRGLIEDVEALQTTVDDTLEAMVAHGDILEHRSVDDGVDAGGIALLYAAPPSFVVRKSGAIILLGIASDQLSALPEGLERRIDYVHHVRHLRPSAGEDLRDDLRQLGLIELSQERWLNAPRAETPGEHVARLDRTLDAVQPSREIPGLFVLDPARPVRFYKGRWTDVRPSHSGRFVGRRAQAFGAHLWCYVEIHNGRPERMVDFPIGNSRWRGCDEAWRLQMALDAQRGQSQQFRTRDGARVVEFFSPVPMWARRRWDAVGEPVASSGCLFAYRLPEAEVGEELDFMRRVLWLQELATERGR